METRCFIKPPVERFRFVALESMTGGGTTGVRVITSMDGRTFNRPASKVEFQPARSTRRGGVVAVAGETNYTATYPCRDQGGVVPTMAISRYGGVKLGNSSLGLSEVGGAITPYLFPTDDGFEQGRNACALPAVQLHGYGKSTSGLKWLPASASPPLGGAPFVYHDGYVFATGGYRRSGESVWRPYPTALFMSGPRRAEFMNGQPFIWQGRVYFGPYRFMPQVSDPFVDTVSCFVSTVDGEHFLVHPAITGSFPTTPMEVVQTAGVFLGKVPQTDTLYASDDLQAWRSVSRPSGVTIGSIVAGFGVFILTASTVGTVVSPRPFAYTATIPGDWTAVTVSYDEQPRNPWNHVYALIGEEDV